MSVPASIINICSNVKLNNKYDHTIYFNSLGEQSSYFAGKVVRTFSAYTYLRKSWSIKIEATMEVARTWSYLFFNNSSGKTYYYFINNVEYISDNTVELFLELDVMQTYHFDYRLLDCFVEREHIQNDAVGMNLVRENLDLGEYCTIDEKNVDMSELCILIQATYDPLTTMSNESMNKVVAAKIDGIYSGLGVYAVPMSEYQAWGTKLSLLDAGGISDGIVTMWMYPKNLVELKAGETWEDAQACHTVNSVKPFFVNTERNTTTAGPYKPRNNKLLTYPYNFLYVTNNAGGVAVYKYEYFGDPSFCNFKVVGSLTPDGVTKIYPINYKGSQHNYDEGLILGNYPLCAWSQDTYKLWLAQNQNTNNLTMASGIIKTVAGVGVTAMTGGLGGLALGGGLMSSGVSDVAGLMAQKEDMSVHPPQAKSGGSTSVNVASGFQHFTIQRKSIDIKQMILLDNYFDMYGYQTNTIKIPNRKVRENWTYTKTVGCHIKGDFANEDIATIESIYDKGVTFWKNGDEICNYSLSNKTL